LTILPSRIENRYLYNSINTPDNGISNIIQNHMTLLRWKDIIPKSKASINSANSSNGLNGKE